MTEITPGRHMLREIAEAPDVVARQIRQNHGVIGTLAARLRQTPPRFVVTCARGSSDAAAAFAKYLLEIRLGLVTASVGPSVRSVYKATLSLDGALFLAVSQSGRSPDLLDLAQAAREGGAFTVALVNDAASPLAEACDLAIPLHAGPEISVAATKSFIASLAAITHLVAAWTRDAALTAAVERLPGDLDAARGLDWSAAVETFVGAAGLFTLGRGPGLAIAQEAALKFKETARLHAEAYSAAEVRHGPLALARPGMPALVFGQNDESRDGTAALARDLAAKGMIVVGAGVPAPIIVPVGRDLHPVTAPLALIQSFYGMVAAVALARGFDPDTPPHLLKVTETR